VASKLRVVAPNEVTPIRPPMTVTTAAADGDRLDLMLAMRARVATAVEDPNTSARDLAALTRRLVEIAKDIDALKLAALQEAASDEAEQDDTFDATAI
jgi:hypothetical protein